MKLAASLLPNSNLDSSKNRSVRKGVWKKRKILKILQWFDGEEL